MPAAQQAITIVCGRDFYLSITNQTGLGNPFNLTGYITQMTVKKNINDSDASAIFAGPPWSSDLPFGKLTFKIPHGTTGGWWGPTGPIGVGNAIVYDIAYADTASPKNWNTILYGPVTLVQPVLGVIPGG